MGNIAAGQLSYIDIIVIALLETSMVESGSVYVWVGIRNFSEGWTKGRLSRAKGKGSRCHYAKKMVSSVILGSRWPELVAFQTSYGIVSARLSASNGRIKSSRAPNSDRCPALLKKISYVSQDQHLDSLSKQWWISLYTIQVLLQYRFIFISLCFTLYIIKQLNRVIYIKILCKHITLYYKYYDITFSRFIFGQNFSRVASNWTCEIVIKE